MNLLPCSKRYASCDQRCTECGDKGVEKGCATVVATAGIKNNNNKTPHMKVVRATDHLAVGLQVDSVPGSGR